MKCHNQRHSLDEQTEPHALIESFEAESECQVVRHAEKDDVKRDFGTKARVCYELPRYRTALALFLSSAVNIDVV